MNKSAFLKESKGFTLLELLVVIAIIGLLSSIVVVGVNKARERGADAKAKADIRNLSTAMQLYFDEKLTYPSLAASGCPSGWSGGCPDATQLSGYISSLPAAPSAPGVTYTYEYTTGGTIFTLNAKKGGAVILSCNQTGCS